MPISPETPLIEPLFRLMGLPPSLVRYCPVSSTKPLRTMYLRDSVLVKGLDAEWDDTCLLTTVDGEHDQLGHIKISGVAGGRQVSGVHLALFGGKGQLGLMLSGDGLKVVIGTGTVLRGGLHLAAKATAFIGDNTTMGQARLTASYADLVVGDDCQLSEDVAVQCNEQHALCDAETGAPLNTQRRHVRIGRHVWLGRRSMVLPDVTIGAGSVVESGAVVSSNVQPNTMVGGAPAQLLRDKVTWKR
ncbi:acyltransferase [Ideonella sp. DXS29W]|uniref:Acyltransferase n=1 Tax=Ideonella lacteola TaxID=2984193 RepID=A0ABU9BQY2_9BURK